MQKLSALLQALNQALQISVFLGKCICIQSIKKICQLSCMESRLFSIPERQFEFRNIILTLKLYSQKRLGTAKTRFCIVEMFQVYRSGIGGGFAAFATSLQQQQQLSSARFIGV